MEFKYYQPKRWYEETNLKVLAETVKAQPNDREYWESYSTIRSTTIVFCHTIPAYSSAPLDVKNKIYDLMRIMVERTIKNA